MSGLLDWLGLGPTKRVLNQAAATGDASPSSAPSTPGMSTSDIAAAAQRQADAAKAAPSVPSMATPIKTATPKPLPSVPKNPTAVKIGNQLKSQ